MPNLKCLCGESINLSPIPNLRGFKVLWEPFFNELIEKLSTEYEKAESVESFEEKVYEHFYPRKQKFPQIYECSVCGRLAVFARASDSKVAFWYQVEQRNSEMWDFMRSLVQDNENGNK